MPYLDPDLDPLAEGVLKAEVFFLPESSKAFFIPAFTKLPGVDPFGCKSEFLEAESPRDVLAVFGATLVGVPLLLLLITELSKEL